MSQPKLLSEVMLEIASNPNDPFGKVLRQCPFIQAELIHRKKMGLDDLTDEQIDFFKCANECDRARIHHMYIRS